MTSFGQVFGSDMQDAGDEQRLGGAAEKQGGPASGMRDVRGSTSSFGGVLSLLARLRVLKGSY